MEITRTRSLTISMGDYESFKTEATVRVTHLDVGISSEHLPKLSGPEVGTAVDVMQALVTEQLDLAMSEDIADAQFLSGNRKSFIHRLPTTEKKD